MKRTTGRWMWMIAAVWGIVGAALLAVAVLQRGPEPPGEDLPAPESGLRTVLVSTTRPEAASSPEGPLHASLIDGEAPIAATVATVLSDEDCAPDAQGYSHCRNEMEMPGGEVVAVRHVHRMTEVPCLYPGERVNVRFS